MITSAVRPCQDSSTSSCCKITLSSKTLKTWGEIHHKQAVQPCIVQQMLPHTLSSKTLSTSLIVTKSKKKQMCVQHILVTQHYDLVYTGSVFQIQKFKDFLRDVQRHQKDFVFFRVSIAGKCCISDKMLILGK